MALQNQISVWGGPPGPRGSPWTRSHCPGDTRNSDRAGAFENFQPAHETRLSAARLGHMSNNENVSNAITRDPETMHGVPVFLGTRVPVQTLFDYLEGGDTLEEFLEGFPTVSRELALAALEEAKQLLLARV